MLELSLTDPTTPGAASELVTSGDLQRIEPVSVVICPVGEVECTAESGLPASLSPENRGVVARGGRTGATRAQPVTVMVAVLSA